MKRNNKIWFVLLMAVFIFSGCAGENITQEFPDQNAAQSEPGLNSEKNLDESSEKILEQGNEETNKSGILDRKQPIDEAGIISYISNEYIEAGIGQRVSAFEQNMLVYGTYLDENNQGFFRIMLLSMDQGALMHEICFEQMELPNVQVCDQYIAVSDWADGQVYILDEALKIVSEFNTETAYCGIYLNSAADKAFCFTKNEGVVILDINDPQAEPKVLVSDAKELLINRYCDQKVVISYIDDDSQLTMRGSIDLDLRRYRILPFDGTFGTVSNCGELWLARSLDDENVFYLGRENRPNMFAVADDVGTVDFMGDTHRILTTAYEQNGNAVRTLYDAEGRFMSQFESTSAGTSIDEGVYWADKDGGYYFTSIDASGRDILVFWDLAVPVLGEDLVLSTAHEKNQSGTAVSDHLYEKADALSEKYGVEIKIAEQVSLEIGAFLVAQENDENYILSALEAVEEVCAAYPQRFIDQLAYGDYKTIEIHLAGNLTKKTLPEGDGSGFTTFTGFFESIGGKSIIVADITSPGSLVQTMHHEMMHLIDNKLAFDAKLDADALYSEDLWQTLNPSDFVYADTYTDLPMEIYTDGYEQWFVDIYSRTYAKEDRARIMENAMVGNEWIFVSSPGRLAKLEYLCKCIRDAFDTEGWPKQTIWEKTLKNAGFKD